MIGFGRSVSQKAVHGSKRYLDKTKKRGIIESKVGDRTVNIAINSEKQARHMLNSDGYIKGRSYFTISEDKLQDIVKKYHGKGELHISKTGQMKETIELDEDIAVNIDNETGIQEPTNRITIHYSKSGVHVVPSRREK